MCNSKILKALLILVVSIVTLLPMKVFALVGTTWSKMTPQTSNVTSFNKIGGKTYLTTIKVGGNDNLWSSADNITATMGNRMDNVIKLEKYGNSYYAMTEYELGGDHTVYRNSFYTNDINKPLSEWTSLLPTTSNLYAPVYFNNKMWTWDPSASGYLRQYDPNASFSSVETSSITGVRTRFQTPFIYGNELYAFKLTGASDIYELYKLVGSNWVYQNNSDLSTNVLNDGYNDVKSIIGEVESGKLYAKNIKRLYLNPYDKRNSSRNIYTSTDKGLTWNLAYTVPDDIIDVKAFKGSVYILTKNHLYKNGVEVNSIRKYDFNGIYADATELVVYGSHYVQSSTDGNTFTLKKYGMGYTAGIYNILFQNGAILAYGEGNLVYRSTDNGLNWSDDVFFDGPIHKVTQASHGSMKLFEGYVYAGGYKSSDGINFTTWDYNTDRRTVGNSVNMSYKGNLWRVVYNPASLGSSPAEQTELQYSLDSGSSWVTVVGNVTESIKLAQNSTYLYYKTFDNKIYRLTDYTGIPEFVTNTPVSPEGSPMYVFNDGTIYLTTLTGVSYYNGSWNSLGVGGVVPVSNNLLIGGGGGNIYKIDNTTKAKTNITYNLNNIYPLYAGGIEDFYLHSNGALFLASPYGVYDPDISDFPKPTVVSDAPNGSYASSSKDVTFTVDANGLDKTLSTTYYTTDGSDPVVGVSPSFATGVLTVTIGEGNSTYKFIAIDENSVQGDIVTFNYFLDGTAPNIAMNPEPSAINSLPESVEITTDDVAATIEYSLDNGTTWNTYTSAVDIVDNPTYLLAKATDALGNFSIKDGWIAIDTSPSFDWGNNPYLLDEHKLTAVKDDGSGHTKINIVNLNDNSESLIDDSLDKFSNRFNAAGNYGVGIGNDGNSINLINFQNNTITTLATSDGITDSLYNPYTDGVNVVWIREDRTRVDGDGVNFRDIVLYNIQNGTTQTVYTSAGWYNNVWVNGDTVAWKDAVGDDKKIFKFSISGNATSTLWDNPNHFWFSESFILDGGNVYIRYDDPVSGDTQVGKINLADNSLTRLTASSGSKGNLVAKNGKVLFTDNNQTMYIANGGSGMFLKVLTIPVSIYGNIAVYYKTIDNKVYYMNLPEVVPADTTPPVITSNKNSGTYNSSISVTLIANETATIYFTTDGSNPIVNNAYRYTSPISINSSKTVKALAVDQANNQSVIYTFNYTIQLVYSSYTPPVSSDEKVDNVVTEKPKDSTGGKSDNVAEIKKIIVPNIKTLAIVNENPTFTDVTKTRINIEIYELAKRGIIKGDGESFRPKQELTRGEFITMLMRTIKSNESNKSYKPFEDEKSIPLWGKSYIRKAKVLGILDGSSEKNMRFNDKITMPEMAEIFGRVAISAQGSKVDTLNASKYSSEYFINKSNQMGYTQKYLLKAYDKKTIKRDQGAKYIYKLISK